VNTVGAPNGDVPAGPAPEFGPSEQLLELLVFLFLIVPSMILSLFVYGHEKATFGLVAWATIARDLALVALIAFFVWRNGEPVARIGWTLGSGWREIVLGAAMFVPFLYVVQFIERVFTAWGLSTPLHPPAFLTPRGAPDVALAVALVVVVALAEETIFRGYLLLRLRAITRGVFWAVVLSAAIFSTGHGYEGSAGMATVGVVGIIFAVIYMWRKSLVAPMVMHFLLDFIGIVIVRHR